MTFKNNILYIKKKRIFILNTFVILIILILGILLFNQSNSYDSEYVYDDSCNVAGVELRGDIYTYLPVDSEGYKLPGDEDTVTSEDIIYYIEEADYDDNIKAILIEVDSYGGSPVAAEEISEVIRGTQKPVVAFIREAGVSAAYYAITPADYIFASRNSEVGGIGVTQSYLDNTALNQKEGYSFVQLSTGKFKDSGSPDKPLTQEEKNLFMRDLDIVHENFVQTVSKNRGIPIEEVRVIADGSTVLGEKAKELGLIDDIGGHADAMAYLETVLGEDVSVCW